MTVTSMKMKKMQKISRNNKIYKVWRKGSSLWTAFLTGTGGKYGEIFSNCRETKCGTESCKNLSAYQREDGYLEGNSCIVSWCLGHLAEYAPPEFYDEKYAKWQFEDLPIIPEVWKVQVSEDKKKQFDVICSLMNRADVAYLVNGCDAGREGELILKEFMIWQAVRNQ